MIIEYRKYNFEIKKLNKKYKYEIIEMLNYIFNNYKKEINDYFLRKIPLTMIDIYKDIKIDDNLEISDELNIHFILNDKQYIGKLKRRIQK